MTDHFDHHDDDAYPHHDPFDELPTAADHDWHHDEIHHEIYEIPDSDHDGYADTPDPHTAPAPDDHHDPAAPEDSFPPALHVDDLPTPVDGFPWIDTALLGTTHLDSVPAAATLPVDPADLAAYAGTTLPEHADGWAILAESDDPATAALARWWQPTDDTAN